MFQFHKLDRGAYESSRSRLTMFQNPSGDSRFYCFIVLLITANIVQVCALPSIQQGKYVETISELLLGELWDQFCGEDRDGQVQLKEDDEFKAFYNGSLNESLEDLAWTQDEKWANLSYWATKAQADLALICSVSSWNYANARLYQQSISSSADMEKCNRRLDILNSLLAGSAPANVSRVLSSVEQDKDQNQAWLQLQAFGRLPAGNWFADRMWPGDYDHCVNEASGLYCLGNLRSPSWPRRESNPKGRHKVGFRVGLCLPKSCTQEMVNKDDNIRKINIMFSSLNKSHGFKLADIYCLPSHDSKLLRVFVADDPLRLILLVFPVFWAAFLIYGTLNGRGDERRDGISFTVRNFDLRKAWTQLMDNRHLSAELIGINAFKVIGMLCLLSSHAMNLLISQQLNMVEFRAKVQHSYLASILTQGQHMVPGFFLITGLLVGLRTLQGVGSKGDRHFSSFKLILLRYSRLMPMYLISYAYVRKFGHLLADGPQWDYGVSEQSETLQCHKESWLVPILMLANFIPPFSHCILTGWHVANDFQIYLVLPFIFCAYGKSRSIGRRTCGLGIVISCLYYCWSLQTNNWSYDLVAQEPFVFGPRYLLGRLARAYTNPIARMGSVLMGVLMADVLLASKLGDKTSSSDELESKKWLKAASVKLPVILGTGATQERQQVDAARTRNDNELITLPSKSNHASRLKAVSISRWMPILGAAGILAAASSMVWPQFITRNIPFAQILALPLNRYGGEFAWLMLVYFYLKRNHSRQRQQQLSPTAIDNSESSILRAPFWNVLVKLNYTVMLTHFTIARYLIQSQRRPPGFDWPSYAQFNLFFITISYAIACPLYLAVELPVNGLARLITSRILSSKH